MAHNGEGGPTCPNCEITMLKGSLTGPVDRIHVESLQSYEGSDLEAYICPECGHIELEARSPEKLAHEDFTEDEILKD